MLLILALHHHAPALLADMAHASLGLLALVVVGVGRPAVLAFGLGDLIMAALFVWALNSQWGSERSDGPLGRRRPKSGIGPALERETAIVARNKASGCA